MHKVYVKDKREALLEKAYLFIETNQVIPNLSLGYLSAVGIEDLNKLADLTPAEVLKNTFLISAGISNIITYIAIFALGSRILLKIVLKKYFKNKTIDSRLRQIYEKYTDKIYAKHRTEGLSWGLGQTVMSAPDMRNGWEPRDISFEVDNSAYSFQMLSRLDKSLEGRRLDEEYEAYRRNEFPKYFTTDSDRLMLTEKPIAMTDDNALCLKLRKVKWSQLQFFWTKILTDDIREKIIDRVFDNKIIVHPNSLCLHLVVKTLDGKILLTENSSNKENDYAKTWAFSLGEQIDKEDVKNLESDCAFHWIKRAVSEELCVREEELNRKSIHFLSVNLEGDIANFAIVCIVEVLLDSENLYSRLCCESRIDNEFKQLDFMDVNDIPKELISQSREYHPSSKIRMLYTYLNMKGGAQLRYQLLKNEYKESER